MLARLFVSVCLVVAVIGELCEFPGDNPIEDLENGDTVPVQPVGNNRVFVYTDQFGDCHGSVRRINFCYQPGSTSNLMTIEIRNPDGNASYDVIVNSNSDLYSCAERYNLNDEFCCVEQTLTQSLIVHPNSHYALVILNTASLLLRSTETVNGNWVDHNGTPNNGPLYKPLFYFSIDTSSSTFSTTVPTPTSSSSSSSTASSTTTVTSPDTRPDATTVTTDTPSDATTVTSSDTPPGQSTKTPSTTSSNSKTTTTTESRRPTSTSSSSKTPTTPPSKPEKQSGGNPSSPVAAAGGVIGALLSIILLLVIVVVVVLMCLKKKQRKVIVKRVGEDTDGFVNVVYGASGTDKMAVSLSSVAQTSNTYEGKKDLLQQKHQYEYIEDLTSKTYEPPTPYTYATPYTLRQYQVLDTSYAAVGAETATGKRPSLHYEVEDIYEAPASNETGLYAQYAKINIATISRNSIRATECLGSGQFGTVNKGVWQSSTSSSFDVAIKTLKSTAKEEDKVKFLQEGVIMGQFRHPNVVRLHGIVREQETVLLVIELLAKEDLREHLLTLRPEEGECVDTNLPHTLLSYCRQVISGLAYLAKKGFVHRDIAARNILLSEDHDTCKIADFGMSRDLADETYYISKGGKIPVKWTAPEALNYKKYSTASDVWSFGCLMYEIWSLGHKPFEGYGNAQAIKIVDGGYRMAPPPGCPRAIYQLMINCWNPTASVRPSSDSASQILSKPDPVLLKWEVADKPTGVPQALQLGAPLNSTGLLYPELQTAYLPIDATNNDYEEPDDD